MDCTGEVNFYFLLLLARSVFVFSPSDFTFCDMGFNFSQRALHFVWIIYTNSKGKIKNNYNNEDCICLSNLTKIILQWFFFYFDFGRFLCTRALHGIMQRTAVTDSGTLYTALNSMSTTQTSKCNRIWTTVEQSHTKLYWTAKQNLKNAKKKSTLSNTVNFMIYQGSGGIWIQTKCKLAATRLQMDIFSKKTANGYSTKLHMGAPVNCSGTRRGPDLWQGCQRRALLPLLLGCPGQSWCCSS